MPPDHAANALLLRAIEASPAEMHGGYMAFLKVELARVG